MSTKPIWPRATVVFCDDIRPEIGNKFSFMGVYDTDLNVSSSDPQVTLPKLCAAITLVWKEDAVPTERIEVKI